jgi:hypothetical protein
MIDDYTEYPTTVGEIKSDLTQDATDWSARDLLINLLRDIDSGKLEIEKLVLSYRRKDGSLGFGNAGESNHVVAVGLSTILTSWLLDSVE